MATITNSYEGGTNGTTISTANSGGGSGTAFNTISGAVAGATLAFSSTRSAHGTLSMQIATGATSGSQWVGWTSGFGSQNTFYVRFNMYTTAYPAVSSTIWRILSGGSVCASINLRTTGQIRVLDANGVQIDGLISSAIPLNQWVRIEAHFILDSASGQAELRIFHAVDSVLADFSANSGADQSLGATTADTYRFGLQSSQVNFGPMWFDDYGLSTDGYLGPAGTPENVLPTISVSVPEVAPFGEQINASAVASDADGSIVSYAWSLVSVPVGSIAVLDTNTGMSTSFMPDLEGNYSLACEATDNSGGVVVGTAQVQINGAFYIWTGGSWKPAYEQTWSGLSWD